MYINKKDHPELWAAKLRRFQRAVDKIVAESREARRLLELELEEMIKVSIVSSKITL